MAGGRPLGDVNHWQLPRALQSSSPQWQVRDGVLSIGLVSLTPVVDPPLCIVLNYA